MPRKQLQSWDFSPCFLIVVGVWCCTLPLRKGSLKRSSADMFYSLCEKRSSCDTKDQQYFDGFFMSILMHFVLCSTHSELLFWKALEKERICLLPQRRQLRVSVLVVASGVKKSVAAFCNKHFLANNSNKWRKDSKNLRTTATFGCQALPSAKALVLAPCFGVVWTRSSWCPF